MKLKNVVKQNKPDSKQIGKFLSYVEFRFKSVYKSVYAGNGSRA